MPYIARPYLDDPADIQVWRYMDIEKLLSILVDQALFFASTRTIASDDWFEGQFTADELVCRLSNRVAFCLSDGERRSGGVDLAQDVFALGFPHVAPGILIARRQEGDDGVGQFSGRGKAFLGNELGQVAKEALDQIHPG